MQRTHVININNWTTLTWLVANVYRKTTFPTRFPKSVLASLGTERWRARNRNPWSKKNPPCFCSNRSCHSTALLDWSRPTGVVCLSIPDLGWKPFWTIVITIFFFFPLEKKSENSTLFVWSRRLNYLADRAKPMMPDTKGAAADVPVCWSVHFPLKSVVN